MIDLKLLKQLIALMKDNDLCELDIRDKDEQVTLKRPGHGGPPAVYTTQAAPVAAETPLAPPVTAAAAPAAKDEGLVPVTSPMVGTFYSAASPDAEPFVRVGSQITADTVVCLIEAMKVFNEIKADVTGTVERVLVSNGQAIEFGQPLFMIRPK